jgi:hypothetical protein
MLRYSEASSLTDSAARFLGLPPNDSSSFLIRHSTFDIRHSEFDTSLSPCHPFTLSPCQFIQTCISPNTRFIGEYQGWLNRMCPILDFSLQAARLGRQTRPLPPPATPLRPPAAGFGFALARWARAPQSGDSICTCESTSRAAVFSAPQPDANSSRFSLKAEPSSLRLNRSAAGLSGELASQKAGFEDAKAR